MQLSASHHPSHAPLKALAWVAHIGTISAVGAGLAAMRHTLIEASGPEREYLHERDDLCARTIPVGAINEALLSSDAPSRTMRIAEACLRQMPDLQDLINRTGPARCAVVLGASTSGLPEVEAAMRVRHCTGNLPEGFSIRALNLNEPSHYVADRLGITGPVYTVSNACASGAMAIVSGVRLLAAGLADLVVAGGVDSLARFTTTGFEALGAVSGSPCTPFASNRHGINLGEGGALVVLTRDRTASALAAVTGVGETCDAHHISAPDPTGAGAANAMKLALESGGFSPNEIDLVSAHGTGTQQNDAAEALAIAEAIGANVPVASYKRLTGHTLAGAGALQAAIAAAHFIDNPEGRLAANASDKPADPALVIRVIDDVSGSSQELSLHRPVRHIATNAFAFGGSNACIIYSNPQAFDLP